MSELIKPCPWCGHTGSLEVYLYYSGKPKSWWVICDNEKCAVQPGTEEHDTEKSALYFWNTRKG